MCDKFHVSNTEEYVLASLLSTFCNNIINTISNI